MNVKKAKPQEQQVPKSTHKLKSYYTMHLNHCPVNKAQPSTTQSRHTAIKRQRQLHTEESKRSPVTGGAEKDGISGVWGALPAWPLVMS